MPLWAQLMAVPFLIALNAFFVISEYALVAIRPSQIETMRSRGWNLAASAMERLRSDMSSAIGAIQVCITMTNLLLGWIGEPAMSAVLHQALKPLGVFLPDQVSFVIATTLSFIIVTLLTVVLSELVPKALTLQYTLVLARIAAVPTLRIRQAIRPMVWVMNALASATTRMLGLGPVVIEGQAPTADEISVIAAEAGDAGVLTARERSLILNTLGLGKRKAHEVMVPRVRATYLDLRRSMAENMAVLERDLYSRLPLCDGGMDRVVGVIYTKEFLTAYQDDADTSVLSLIARPVVFMPVTVGLDRLLAAFHEKRTHLLFLVDEYGGVEGIVTLTDVVDELVGEMPES
jgi:CBS domain containing-hemolysin-like protein